MLAANDFFRIVHPFLAVIIVFPLLGMVTYFALQTRKRRLLEAEGKGKIPPSVGPEHLKLGKILSGAVVAIALLGIGHPIASKMIANQTFADPEARGRVILVVLFFLVTILSLIFLYRSQSALWRSIFGLLTAVGVLVLGQQPEVFKREYEWAVSHYYYGIIVTFLMIVSLVIFPDIYRDRTQTWRRVHIILNSIALLFFIGQGITGTRDLLEIPLKWQEPVVFGLYNPECQNNPCQIEAEAPQGTIKVTIGKP